ncbi:DUF2232 domain-containing protein [Paenibacillus sp. 481]|uniref:DUF2232 domain-containing protein n=1 Tax=Paenibacillus sp. 481 TaxID=2835869 RepID=UPI001E40C0F1|nr:DUF2232 domain-containing protein [Paenibacillus sp. 481]UHA75388.1 DUF2232 domain-containing protein [Paenibacillus sp. 481]
MKNRWSSVAWAVAALVLLLSISHPIQVLTMSFMAIPIVMLSTMLSVGALALHLVALLAIVFMLFGQLGSVAVLQSLYFIIPGIVLGQMFKRKRPAWNSFLAVTITFLIQSLLLLAFASVVLNFNLTTYITEAAEQFSKSLEQSGVAGVMQGGFSSEQIALYAKIVGSMLPFWLIGISLYMGTITYAFSRLLLAVQGIDVNKLKPVREWRLPKSLIWYYLFAVILRLATPVSTDSFLTLILFNLEPLLDLAFAVQGISLLFFIAHEKKWKKAIPVVIVVVGILLLSPLMISVLRIVGMIDLLFPLRQAISKPRT